MKINRFNKMNENSNEMHYIFSFISKYGPDGISNFLFNNETSAFGFLLNRVYNEYKEHGIGFNSLNKCGTLDELVEEYQTYIEENDDYPDNFYFDAIPVNNEKSKVDDWILLKRTARKYNL